MRTIKNQNKVIFVIGGARSGKSSYALELAKKTGKGVAFIATCTAPDKEMKEKIKLHRLSRPRHWKLIEEGNDIASVLPSLKTKYKVILIDCLGIWVSNLLIYGLKDKEVKEKFDSLIESVSNLNTTMVLVSNEVGCGVVPDSLLARRFRDLLGSLNQKIAKIANEVIVMQTGLPIKIKGA